MKRTALAALLALTCLAAAASGPSAAQRRSAPARAAPSLPVFSFLGQTTEGVTGAFALGNATCTPRPTGQSGCSTDYANVIPIGNARLLAQYFNFHDGRLYNVSGNTVAGFHPQLLEAFTAKYGKPARTEVRKWQNRLGASFDNPVAIWLFKGGTLELRALGSKSDETSFSFVSVDNAPPRVETPVNF